MIKLIMKTYFIAKLKTCHKVIMLINYNNNRKRRLLIIKITIMKTGMILKMLKLNSKTINKNLLRRLLIINKTTLIFK